MTGILFNLQITLFTLMALGFFLYNSGVIKDNDQKFLTTFVLNFLLPINVFVSFVENISMDMLKSLFGILLIAIVAEILLLGFTKIVRLKSFTEAQRAVASYAFLVSNGGLIGTPVIEGLFGGVGVMYCNVFLIPMRIVAYTAGEGIFNPEAKKGFKDSVISVLTNRIFLAMVIGLILSFLHLSLPVPVFTALKNTGKCLSPMSMILVGSLLAEKQVFNKELLVKISTVTVIRLLIIPMVALLACKIIKLDLMTTTIVTLMFGMPCGSTGAMFAKKYNGDSQFASIVVFVTTLLATFTLVGVMAVIELVF